MAVCTPISEVISSSSSSSKQIFIDPVFTAEQLVDIGRQDFAGFGESTFQARQESRVFARRVGRYCRAVSGLFRNGFNGAILVRRIFINGISDGSCGSRGATGASPSVGCGCLSFFLNQLNFMLVPRSGVLGLQIDGNELGDALLFHGHPKEGVGKLHAFLLWVIMMICDF
jgi:hypothetical protein